MILNGKDKEEDYMKIPKEILVPEEVLFNLKSGIIEEIEQILDKEEEKDK